MAHMDWEKERQRLADVYSRMDEAELQEIADDPGSLSDPAREALQTEVTRRGLPSLPPKAETAGPKESNRELPAPVMIRRYRDLPIAQLAKATLDSAGIESFLVDENLVRLDWFYSNLIGGVKLFVRSEDAAEASKVLDDVVSEDLGNQSSPG